MRDVTFNKCLNGSLYLKVYVQTVCADKRIFSAYKGWLDLGVVNVFTNYIQETQININNNGTCVSCQQM